MTRRRFAWRPTPGTALIASILLALGLGFSEALPRAEKGERKTLASVAGSHFDPEFLARARSYQRPRVLVMMVELAITFLVALLILAGPWKTWSRWLLPHWLNGYSVLSRLWILTAVYLGFELLRFPFRVFFYTHAKGAGLRHDPWLSFLSDRAKGLAVGWVEVILVGLVVLWLLASFPRWGWLWGTLAIGILSAAYMVVAPLVIDPLFNRFRPLENPALRARLLDLAREGGVPAREILVADASRRTRAVNAYFTGLGGTRRIVLYDTLLEKFDEDEIAVVLAHEVGHWKHHHVMIGILWGMVGSLMALGVLSLFLGRATGALGRGDPLLALPVYALVVVLMTLAIPPGNFISRRLETEADLASLELTRSPEAFIRSEVHLARENLAEVLPPSWIETLFYSHPSTVRRILLAEGFR